MAEEQENVEASDPAQADPQSEPVEAAEPAPAPADSEETPQPAEKSGKLTPLPNGKFYVWGTGRRKKSIAQVRIRPGTGKFLVNKRQIDAYFVSDRDRQTIVAPLETVEMRKAWDVWVNVNGGGSTGQAGAIALGLSRALVKAEPKVEHSLREAGLMTRDARMSERKKYGQPGARKRFQFSKR